MWRSGRWRWLEGAGYPPVYADVVRHRSAMSDASEALCRADRSVPVGGFAPFACLVDIASTVSAIQLGVPMLSSTYVSEA